jgi:uncharacterized membrane protein YccC
VNSIMRRTGGTTVRSERHTDQAISHGVLLAVCCLLSYKIIIVLLTVSRFVPRDDELLGGMWAVVATIFVFRRCYEESANAALMRASATLFSFGLCLIYLLIFPFRPWGMVSLIAIGAIVLEVIGRSEDVITACITTAVVLVVAGISPEHAWKQPILRLMDTIVGIVVGILGAWIAQRVPRLSSLSNTPFPVPREPNHDGTSRRTYHSADEAN